MATQEDELALRLTGLTLIGVSRALRDIADRLDASSRAAHQPNPIDTRRENYPDTDTDRSTTSSHDWLYSPRRGRSQGSRFGRSEAESRGGHVHDNPLVNAYPPDQLTQRRHPNVVSPHLSQDHAPRSSSNHFEPRVARRSDYSESRPTRQSEYGHNGRLDGSPPLSPTPLRRRSSHQPPRSLSSFTSNDTILDDIFDLDETLVRRRTPDCDPTIHHPARGTQGSQSRWYFVCCGRKVGIFNEWNDVKAVTDGVSGCHQQRVDNESLAYTYFKRALLSGKVEVAK